MTDRSRDTVHRALGEELSEQCQHARGTVSSSPSHPFRRSKGREQHPLTEELSEQCQHARGTVSGSPSYPFRRSKGREQHPLTNERFLSFVVFLDSMRLGRLLFANAPIAFLLSRPLHIVSKEIGHMTLFSLALLALYFLQHCLSVVKVPS